MTGQLSILYVDDEPDIRLIVEMALNLNPSLSTRTAASGEEALGMVIGEGWRPDLIMVDVMMPGLTGPEVLAALLANPGTAEIPVIFVTARARPPDIEAYIAQGARAVIVKPFDPMSLATQVIALVS
jgi:two-component system OmpR family response regulator